MSEKLNFKVSSALKSVIGRDLITNDFVAIFELVKNSYDAGATNIDLVFQSNGAEINRIFVVDNGKGMRLDDIKNKWLFVAYSAKNDGTEDNEKRVYAGNKGVGRFSCDRLGAKLVLQSHSKSDHVTHKLNVDWGDFESDSTSLFETVKVDYSTQDAIEPPIEILNLDYGTVLEVSQLRDPKSWDRKKLLKLKEHLAKLIDPFGDSKSKFKVNLKCQQEAKADKHEKEKLKFGSDIVDLKIVNGPVQNRIFDALKEKTTWLEVYISESNELISQLIDRGELIYKISEPIGDYKELLNTNFSCQLFYLNRSAKQTFSTRMGLKPVAFGSLFLFRNGFRVFPVGEPNDDTWGINRRRQQGYSRYLGVRDLLGRVDVAGPEDQFKESSSRDTGLVANKATSQLYELVKKKCLLRLESYVVGITWRDKIDSGYDTPQRMLLDENKSKIIELVSALAISDEVELLDFSDNLIQVLGEKSNYFEDSLEQLSKLAETTNNTELHESIAAAKKKFSDLKISEEKAIAAAEKEALARKQAEAKAESALESKKVSDQRVELLTTAYEEEKKRSLFRFSSEVRDKDFLESFLHQITIYASSSKQKITEAIAHLRDAKTIDQELLSTLLAELLQTTNKIVTSSRFATTANFRHDSEPTNDDLCHYFQEYLNTICTVYADRIDIKVEHSNQPFTTHFTPIEMALIADNLVNNAKKHRASEITFEFKVTNNILEIAVTNDGKKLDQAIIEPDRIFEKGYTTTTGSGMGLYHTRQIVERMGGEINLLPSQPDTGFQLVIRIRKI